VLPVGIPAFIVVFACFAGYAYLSTPVYRTSAQVAIESTGTDTSALSPLEAARRLHEAVLDRDLLSRFSNEQAPSATPEVHIQIARAIQAAFQIDSVDGRIFTVSFRDSDGNRVERRCNELAARAVERGPRLLAPEHSEEAKKLEKERRDRVNQLVAFLSTHPELAAEQQKTPEKVAVADNTDAELRAERVRLEARLAPRATEGASDNPYADPASVDVDAPQILKRLAEINAAIAARRATPTPPKAQAAQTPPAVTAEWQRLLAEVSRARVAADNARNKPVTFTARLLSRAVAPAWPLEPDRKLLLLWGVFAGLGAFAFMTLLVRGLGARAVAPAWSSFPPPADTLGSSSFPAEDAGNLGGGPPLSSAPPLPLPSLHPPSLEAPPLMRSPLPERTGEYASGHPLPISPSRVIDSSTPPPLPQPDTPRGLGGPGYGRDGGHVPAAQVSNHVGPGYSGMRSERSFRAAVEVNADLPAPEHRANSSGPPVSVAPTSARTTQVLGSPIPPIIAPGSRRTPSAGAPLQAPRTTPLPRATGYSYVSTPPPGSLKSGLASSSPPSPSSKPTTISTRPAPPGWRPDLSLLPESRRALCDEIYPQAVDRCLVIAVIDGADGGEAKSRLTAELALALAEIGHPRVLVLEGNLQRPAVRRFLRVEMPAGCGLSEQLQSRIDAPRRRPWTVVECTGTLHVLAEGANGSPELILSRPFEDCVSELRSFYDFIVLDGPALSDVPACRAINDVIDSAVLRAGSSAANDLAEANVLFPAKRIALVSGAR
jgi:Mrp family chromosome partitioning ATPase